MSRKYCSRSTGVALENAIAGTGVKVGSGVKVLRDVGVMLGVAVAAGMATIVCREAASAVCAIIRLIAFGSSVEIGVGVARDGTQEVINKAMIPQIKTVLLDNAISPL